MASASTYPYPVAHCAMCEHSADCERRRDEDDHLSGVAHMRRDQVQRLNEAGIRTIEDLSGIDLTRRIGIGAVALERLRHQAALQTEHRRTGVHRYDLLPVDERTGFRLLPAASPGDVFFDMEGDPYFSPERGLEYLFGFTTIDEREPRFRAFQGLDRRQEKAAFEQFIDFVCARLEQWPDLHVYHYAAYEPSALKRLMAEHATREDELDDLLRREVFVDLYQVVRQSMRISHPSYSIKKVRTFFMEGAGQGAVTEGGDSILEFERWRRTGDPAILQAITDYNEEDCLSTLKLRDWLIERKAEAERAVRGRHCVEDHQAVRGDREACRGRRADRSSPRADFRRSAHRRRSCSPISSTTIGARPSPSGGPTSIARRSRWTICSTTPRPSRT